MSLGVPNIPDQFGLRRNDTFPSYQINLYDPTTGDPLILENVSGVVFTMRRRDGTLKIERVAAVVVVGPDAVSMNRLKYNWVSGDTDESGTFAAEFEVTFTGGTKRTFPPTPDQEMVVRIYDDKDAT